MHTWAECCRFAGRAAAKVAYRLWSRLAGFRLTHLFSALLRIKPFNPRMAPELQPTASTPSYRRFPMHIPSLPANVFTSAASQALTQAASTAASTVKNFASNLDSSNIGTPQSFLSTLQQKISVAGQNSGSTSLSQQVAQLNGDLKSGNLSAAKTDYSQLEQSLSALKDQSTTGAGAASSAAMAAYSALQQQSAYSSALNLSMPASMPSLSVSF
jgi:hypothetical protein